MYKRQVAALSISVSQSNTMLSSGKKNEHRITGWNPLRADHKTAPAQAASAHAVPYAGRLFTSSRWNLNAATFVAQTLFYQTVKHLSNLRLALC